MEFLASSTQISEVLTQITKIDPTFNKMEWLRFCEAEVIPNVLEAWIRMDLTVLEDWCLERVKFRFFYIFLIYGTILGIFNSCNQHKRAPKGWIQYDRLAHYRRYQS